MVWWKTHLDYTLLSLTLLILMDMGWFLRLSSKMVFLNLFNNLFNNLFKCFKYLSPDSQVRLLHSYMSFKCLLSFKIKYIF